MHFSYGMQTQSKFQFQSGAIKGLFYLAASIPDVLFQFQSGAIKGMRSTFDIRYGMSFQFQSGAIKGIDLIRLRRLTMRFNSSLVRLKGST